ncbi:MAG: LptA/OstA family protein [Opitutaceae bacterium]|jgi:lipopolysaccharide export system protein LptA|nr:LptA/OstA family protein [Opitutaceae bacterium]
MKTHLLPALLALLAPLPLSSAADTAKPAAPPQPTVVTSDKLEMWTTDEETRAIFTGNVTATGDNIRVTCDHLEITARSLSEKDSKLSTIEKFKALVATGSVHLVQAGREVTCGRAEVLPGEDKLILTESPVVIDHSGPYVSTGDRIVLHRGEKRITGDNIRTTLPPVKDLGARDALQKETAKKQP